MLKTKSQLYQNQCGRGICVKCDRVHHTLLTSKSDCQEDTRRRQISSLSPGSCWSRQVPRSGHAVILTAVTGDTHTHTVRHCSSDCGCYNNETLSLTLSLTCPEFHECSTCRCVCLCALLKCHWMSCGLLSSQLQSGRHWPPGSSSLHHAAWWKTNAPRTPGHLRQTEREGDRGREMVK